MKTFDEAFDALLKDDADFTTREDMDRYKEIGLEILSSGKVDKWAHFLALKISRGELTQAMALRYSFGQGVLTGIEMEKS